MTTIKLQFDARWVIIALLVVIGGMLAAWRPWHARPAGDRTISVTGESSLQAEADNFVFYPSYEFSNSDRDAALKALGDKSDQLVAKLKTLGASDANIKTSSNGYSKGGVYYPTVAPASPGASTMSSVAGGSDDTPTYDLQLTVTAISRDQAQKIQDYLATTSPSGTVSPNPTFSDAKRKQLESQARDAATKDARSKADQSAKNLGFKVGDVKSVADGSGFGATPVAVDGSATGSAPETTASLNIQPGQNSLSYSVTVVYYVR